MRFLSLSTPERVTSSSSKISMPSTMALCTIGASSAPVVVLSRYSGTRANLSWVLMWIRGKGLDHKTLSRPVPIEPHTRSVVQAAHGAFLLVRIVLSPKRAWHPRTLHPSVRWICLARLTNVVCLCGDALCVMVVERRNLTKRKCVQLAKNIMDIPFRVIAAAVEHFNNNKKQKKRSSEYSTPQFLQLGFALPCCSTQPLSEPQEPNIPNRSASVVLPPKTRIRSGLQVSQVSWDK